MKDKSENYRFDNIVDDPKRGFLQKYQDTIIGSRSLVKLTTYELLMLLANPVPGALGLALRKALFPHLFGSVGKGVIFGQNISVRAPGGIHIGDKALIDDYVMLSHRGGPENSIRIGERSLIGRFTQLHTRGGDIDLHEHVNISASCHLVSANKLTIGAHTLIAGGCYIGGLQHKFSDRNRPIIEQGVDDRGGVHIGKDCWLGAHVIVNDGVTIGDGSIIGSGAVVTKDIPPYSIAVGTPARVIRERGE